MIQSKDGRYLSCTNAAPLITWLDDAYPELLIYDVHNDFALTKLTTADCPSLDSALTPFTSGAMTPDGKWLVVGGSVDPHILVIDMTQMQVVNCLDITDRYRCCFAAQNGM